VRGQKKIKMKIADNGRQLTLILQAQQTVSDLAQSSLPVKFALSCMLYLGFLKIKF